MGRASPKTQRAVAVALAVAVAVPVGGAFWRAARAVGRERGLSVLLVTVDTLRADALGAYGHPRAGTPLIDRLAAEGVRFERAHAHSVVTLPSHASILSGRYPFDHGVRDNANFRFPAGMPTVATILKAQGYRTGAFVSAFPLDSRFGLDRGFDVYDDRFGAAGEQTAFHMQERRGAETVTAAGRWLAAQGDAPVFCWVHLYEPHWPYEPPEPLASRFRGDAYHGEVSAADAALAPLLEPILKAGRAGRTLVVLTADHGEALGEHGEQTHGIFAYEATLRVPGVLYAPRILRPRVVRQAARQVDLLPTILDALALPVPGGLPGRSLLPVTAGRTAPAAASYFESLSAAMNRGWAPLHGVVGDGMKYIDLPIPELYDLGADPGEKRNLAAREPQKLEELRGLLAELRRADRGPSRIAETAEVRERLRSLGYLASADPALKERYREDDDPKRLIGFDAEIQEVLARYAAGDLGAALTLCRDIVRRRPMPLALMHLAFLERERGDLGAATEAARRALSLNPADSEVAGLLGVYFNEAGRAREAAALLLPYATRPDPDIDVLTARGMALASFGRGEEALAAFERVRQLDPSNAMALANMATVHLMRGDRARARAGFEAALALEPGLARAYNSLGVIAAEEGDLSAAVERWRRALALDPHDHQTLFNLGMALGRLGRRTEAREFLERYVREAPPATERRDLARVREWLARGGPATP